MRSLLPTSNSNEQFEDMDITSFQWAFAITGLTVAVLECLEIGLDRVVEKRVIAHRSSNTGGEPPAKKSNNRGTDVIDIDEESSSNNDNNSTKGRNDGHNHHDHEQVIDKDHPFSSLLLTIALSIHSIIEGLGIGATDDIGSLQSSFVAVAFHKGFTAFALGNGLVSNGYWSDKSKRKWFYISVGTFIVVALLGIGIGWAISSAGSSLTTAVLTGLTAGSFIYVATLEILPEESATIKRESLPIFPVAFFFIAGYCLMALLGLWA